LCKELIVTGSLSFAEELFLRFVDLLERSAVLLNFSTEELFVVLFVVAHPLITLVALLFFVLERRRRYRLQRRLEVMSVLPQ
jgi:hypothetical protein